MKILVTAGNTQAPLDQVRCITNIFSGRTGAQIASHAFDRGHIVTLLTSAPNILESIPCIHPRIAPKWEVHTYRTFGELASLMESHLINGTFDAVIHAAAVSDFLVAGIYVPTADTHFNSTEMAWNVASDHPQFTDATAGKVKSSHAEIWIRLTPAPKLVDCIRSPWGFRGQLVKFKLEVGATEAELRDIAERSRVQSDANLMAANILEGMHEWAIVGDANGYRHVSRSELADMILDYLESHHTSI